MSRFMHPFEIHPDNRQIIDSYFARVNRDVVNPTLTSFDQLEKLCKGVDLDAIEDPTWPAKLPEGICLTVVASYRGDESKRTTSPVTWCWMRYSGKKWKLKYVGTLEHHESAGPVGTPHLYFTV